jgi:hypothetical protein
MILHVEHELWGGPYRITTEQPDNESDVLAWLWQGDPPAGTEVKLAEDELGYKKFDATGIHEEESQELKPVAYDWLTKANPESYEEYLARLAEQKKKLEEFLNSTVPHLGGVTFREVLDNYDTWKGLRESDGWFVWVGFDPAYSNTTAVIEMSAMSGGAGEDIDEKVNREIRSYVDQGNSLELAVSNVMKDQFDRLKMLIIAIAGAGAGGAP